MKEVELGSQGLRVHALGLGCMGMSEYYGSSSEAENLRVLDRAVEIGCTFWDTSDAYGPFTNEILLSKALEGRRDRITLATKFGVSRGADGSYQGVKGGAEYVKASCDASGWERTTSTSTFSTGWTPRPRSRRRSAPWPSS